MDAPNTKLPSFSSDTILEIVARCAHVDTIDDLENLIGGQLKQLLQYEIMLCGRGAISDRGCYAHKYHNHGFPLDYFYDLQNPNGTVDSPLMKLWRTTGKPVYFQSGRDDHAFPQDWVRIFNHYNLRNTLGSAILNRHDVASNYFIFARIRGEVGPEHANALELITPNLSAALVRALENIECNEAFAGAVHTLFSKKQREILKWIYYGKTNAEIAQILDIKEETIKYHVEQAMAKLDVKTRAQAIGKALEIGVIDNLKR